MRQQTAKNAGNILIELTVVVLIVSIGIRLYTPTHSTYPITHLNMEHVIQSAINQCRLLALSTLSNTTLCPSHNSLHCAGNWHSDSLICQQHNKTVFHNTLHKNYPHTWHANFENKPFITFRPDGSTTKEQGHFSLGCTSTLPCTKVYINFNGSTRLERAAMYQR